MIQLTNLQRLRPRSDDGLQSGYDQDIYRVLAIAQTVKTILYTAAEVIRLGWHSADQKEAYQDEYAVLYAWANKKDITGTSHNKDEAGNFLKPAKWNGEGWQDEVAHKLWNRAVQIINEALDLKEFNEDEGRANLFYWYDVAFGSFAVTQDQQPLIIAIANRKHAAEKAAKKSGEPVNESWKSELRLLLFPETAEEIQPEQEPEPEEEEAAHVARLVAEQLENSFNMPAAGDVAELVTARISEIVAKTQPNPADLAELVTERLQEMVGKNEPPIPAEPLSRRKLLPWLASVAALLLAFIWFTQPENDKPDFVLPELISEERLNTLSQELSISDATVLTTTIQKKATSQLPLNRWESYAANWDDDRLIISAEYSEHQNPRLFVNCPVVLASLP